MTSSADYMRRAAIVLDKNFLQGKSAREIRELADSHQLLMTDNLFYELLSTDKPKVRAACFAKLGDGENPVLLIGHTGMHLRYEMAHGMPSSKPSSLALDIRYKFHPGLSTLEYELPSGSAEAVEEETDDLKLRVERYVELIRTAPVLAPSMDQPGSMARLAVREKVEQEIAEDHDVVLQFLMNLVLPHLDSTALSSADGIDSKWALFREIQVRLLFAVDAYARYGGNLTPLTAKRYREFEHDVLDQDYLTLGVLEGAFATREKKLQRFYKLLCPEGRLHT